MVCDTNIRKSVSHLITYQSGRYTSQIHYILTRNRDMLVNVKLLPSNECTTQHRLVASNFGLRTRKQLEVLMGLSTEGDRPNLWLKQNFFQTKDNIIAEQ